MEQTALVGDLALVLALVAGVAVVCGLARRLHLPAPILLVLTGVAISSTPGIPHVSLEPGIVLLLILPPLLYAAALNASFTEIRANLRPIGLLSIGLVLATAVAVGAVAHLAVRGLDWAPALALGAIVAPPDAIAAVAVARQLRLPHRVLTVLEGESLLNDATALVTYRIAVAAVVSGVPTAWRALGDFAWAVVGGVAIGLAVAVTASIVRSRLNDPLVENSLALITPFGAYLPAEAAHSSGVLAVVVAGIYVGRHSPVRVSSSTRLQAQALWGVITFLLEGAVFALIGLQFSNILHGLGGRSVGTVTTTTIFVIVTVIVVRMAWIFPVGYLPRRLSRRVRQRDPNPPWQYHLVVGWAGMRGVVSLAAAFALPPGFPSRDLILFVTFAVIAVTLVVQGLSLPWLVRRLGLDEGGDDAERAERNDALADHHIARRALGALDELTPDDARQHRAVDKLRGSLEDRVRHAHAVLGGCPGEAEYVHSFANSADARADAAAATDLRLQLIGIERAELVRLNRAGDVDDATLKRVQAQLDFEEVAMPP